MLAHPEEFIGNMYRYYRHKAMPKISVWPIVLVVITFISMVQVTPLFLMLVCIYPVLTTTLLLGNVSVLFSLGSASTRFEQRFAQHALAE